MAAQAQVRHDFDGPEDRQLADDIATRHAPPAADEPPCARRDGAWRRPPERLTPIGDAPLPTVRSRPPPRRRRRRFPSDPRSLEEVIDDLDHVASHAAQRRLARQGAARASHARACATPWRGLRRSPSPAASSPCLSDARAPERAALTAGIPYRGSSAWRADVAPPLPSSLRRRPGDVRSPLGDVRERKETRDRFAGLGGDRRQQREIELLPVCARLPRRRRQHDAGRELGTPPRGKAIDGDGRLRASSSPRPYGSSGSPWRSRSCPRLSRSPRRRAAPCGASVRT